MGIEPLISKSECKQAAEEFGQTYFDFKIENKLTHAQVLNKSKSIRNAMQLFEQNEIEKFLKIAGFKKIEPFFRWFNFIGFIAIK